MSAETVFLFLVALCAATASVDPRARRGTPPRVLGAAVAAALAPALLGAVVLGLADPGAAPEPLALRALAASGGVGVLVGIAALGAQAVWNARHPHSPAA